LGDPTAGDAFAALVTAQLTEERARKSSLESRGLTLITSSGAFATLVLALAGLITARKDFDLDGVARACLLGAVIAFLAAGVLGVLCNAPLNYDEPKAAELKGWVKDNWKGDASAAQRAVVESDIETLTVARDKNWYKAKLLTWGISVQVVGMLGISAAAGVVLVNG
jgi:hypothetical protein